MSYGWEAWGADPEWVLPGDPALPLGHDGAAARQRGYQRLNALLLLNHAHGDLARAVLPAPRATQLPILESDWPDSSRPAAPPTPPGPSWLALRQRCEPTRGPDHPRGHSDWQRARTQEPCPVPP